MKRVRNRAVAVGLVLAAALSACSGAKAPNAGSQPQETSGGTTPAGSDTTVAGGGDTTVPGELKPIGVREEANTILTPAPTKELDEAVWAVYRETSTLDPLFVFDYPDNAAMFVACEALLRTNPDLTIGPGLATDITWKSDKALVITLRDGVTFFDGTPMTAEDVAFSLNRQKDPANGGFYGAYIASFVSADVTGPLEVTITTTQRDNALYGELAGPVGTVIEKKVVEEQGANYGTPNGQIGCTGPMKLESWKVGEGVTFVRNDSYWDTSLPRLLKKLTLKGVPDEAVLTSGLLTGEIDGSYAILSTLDQLRNSDSTKVYEGPGYASSDLIVNATEGPLADARVRQALSMAIDRQGLVQAVYKGAGYPARSVAPAGTWGYEKDTFIQAWNDLPDVSTPDVEGAKKLIAEAGVEGQTIRIGMSTELNNLNVTANEIKRAAESIGLKAELVSRSAAEYITFFIDAAARADVDCFLTVNYPDYPDPLGLYATMVAPGSQAFSNYDNPEAVKLVDQARTAATPADQAAAVVALQHLMEAEDRVWIPLVEPSNTLVMSKDITGAPGTFMYMFGPWAAYLGAP